MSLLVPPRKVEYCSVPVAVLTSDTNATPFVTVLGAGIELAVTGKFDDPVVPLI